MMGRFLFLWLTVLPCAVFGLDQGEYKVVEETWAIIQLQGKRVGFSNTVTLQRETSAGTHWKTVSHQRFKLRRMDAELTMRSSSTVVEDAEGTVLQFGTRVEGAGTNVGLRGFREGNEMVLEDGTRAEFPKEAIGPAAYDRVIKKLSLQPGTSWRGKAFIVDFPTKPATIELELAGKEKKNVNNRLMELWRLNTKIDLLPDLVSTAWIDSEHRTQYALMPFPGIGMLEYITSTRDEALMELESADFFTNTLIRPSQLLKNERQLKHVIYRLKTKGRNKLELWSGKGQEVRSNQNGEAILEVSVPEFHEEEIHWELPIRSLKKGREFLQSTPYLEVDHPVIEQLAKDAVQGETHPLKAAKKIEKFVADYVQTKDLSIGFASALATARSRKGDCTEHAVLAAALGRAVGLPTRVVVGLGYIPNDGQGRREADEEVFGFHMWAEAWMCPKQWFPMDPSLGGFTVGRIAISKFPMTNANPLMDVTLPILQLIEGLEIEVLKME